MVEGLVLSPIVFAVTSTFVSTAVWPPRRRYHGALPRIDAMVEHGDNGRPVSNGLHPAARSWVLERLGDQAAPSARPPAAIVKFWDNGRLGGMLSCNGIGGAAMWLADGTFANLEQPLRSTLIACGGPADRGKLFAERFWVKMPLAKRWRIEGRLLEIRFSDGAIARLREVAPES